MKKGKTVVTTVRKNVGGNIIVGYKDGGLVLWGLDFDTPQSHVLYELNVYDKGIMFQCTKYADMIKSERYLL
jgi:hypothetical protein